MPTHELKEIDGTLKEVPITEKVDAPDAPLDEISWFEDDAPKGYSGVIEYNGKRFWIMTLSRAQNAAVDKRLKVIADKSRQLSQAARKNAKQATDERSALIEKLTQEIPQLQRENEEKVLLYALKFWDLRGKREVVKREDVLKLHRPHQSELYDRVMQKSRMGRSEGNF